MFTLAACLCMFTPAACLCMFTPAACLCMFTLAAWTDFNYTNPGDTYWLALSMK